MQYAAFKVPSSRTEFVENLFDYKKCPDICCNHLTRDYIQRYKYDLKENRILWFFFATGFESCIRFSKLKSHKSSIYEVRMQVPFL